MKPIISSRLFDCFIHPRPQNTRPGPGITVAARRIATLDHASMNATRGFECGYDEVAANLMAIPGIFLEPDGSFIWVRSDSRDAAAWRLEGQLTDSGVGLACAELRGFCAPAQLDRLLVTLGWPATAIVFQLRELGVFVDEATFRQLFIS